MATIGRFTLPPRTTIVREASNGAREIRTFASYLISLRRFLREPVTEEQAIARIQRQLEGRTDEFLRMLAEGVFANPRSPYLQLFRAAAIEHGDVVSLVRSEGLEPALERLYDEGIRVTLDELRCRQPIRRRNLELAARLEDFDNPLTPSDLISRTGGSRSGGTLIGRSFFMAGYEAGYYALLDAAFDLRGARTAVWFPAPPVQTGLMILLRQAKLGKRIERWFTQTEPTWRGGHRKHALLTRATLLTTRLAGVPFEPPRYTPPEQAAVVAHWLQETKERGELPSLITNPGSAVRVCRAALELGLDISGTFFRLGGEPYTAGKAEVIAAAGCRAANSYFMIELGGFAGISCASPAEFDEVHLLTDKVAVISRDKQVSPEASIRALAYTTVHSLCPKLLINLESDDYGILGNRDCGCALEQAGLSLHLHGIRSYEKLTSEGVAFAGSDIITLLEQALPHRFGGSPTDYQLVEYEDGGMPRVAILVSPRLGELNDVDVVGAAISFLRSRGKAQSVMADLWEENRTLHVIRRDPYVTDAAKTPALHVLRPGEVAPTGA